MLCKGDEKDQKGSTVDFGYAKPFKDRVAFQNEHEQCDHAFKKCIML